MGEPRELSRQVIDAVVVELATVLHSRLGTAVSAAPSEEGRPWHWIVTCRVHGAWVGQLRLGLSEADAVGVTAGMREPETPADDASLAAALREVVGQAVALAMQRAELVGLQIDVESILPAGSASPEAPAVFRLQVGETPHSLAMWCEPQGVEADADADAAATASPAAAAPAVDGQPRPVRTDPTEGQTPAADAARAGAGDPGEAGPSNLEVILDIDLPISVRFGQTEMTLDALVKLAPGSLIDLARSPDDPVDLLVNGVPIARGEVVVVSGNYGLRVAEVVSPADRLRSVRR